MKATNFITLVLGGVIGYALSTNGTEIIKFITGQLGLFLMSLLFLWICIAFVSGIICVLGIIYTFFEWLIEWGMKGNVRINNDDNW